jgi:hypothetical protein
MQRPMVAEYQEVITKYFLMSSMALMFAAFIGIAIRVNRNKKRATQAVTE